MSCHVVLITIGVLICYPQHVNPIFCFKCESIENEYPPCVNIDLDDPTYVVDCYDGACSKTVRLINGTVIYTKRSCSNKHDDDFTCNSVIKTPYYEEIECTCDINHCNQSNSRSTFDLTLFILLILIGQFYVI